MGNTLTGLIPALYRAMDTVSREMVGFIPAVALDPSDARAAVGQDITSHIAPAAAAEDITPGTNPPDTGDQTIGNVKLQITKSKCVPFRWTGEEQKSVSAGPGYQPIRNDQMAQAIRTLVNLIEVDLGALYTKASRAVGAAGTTPFGTNLGDSAQTLKVLKDNGAPVSDLQLVGDTSMGANLRTLANLTKVNEAGTDVIQRQGILLPLHNQEVRESAGVPAVHTKGTGTAYTTNGTGLPIGTTSIPLITGSGTIVAGDVVTFAGDANKYVVTTGIAAPGTIVIAEPGLRKAIPAAATALTVGNSYVPNLAFHRNAIVLATRAPALPEEGDSADDRFMVTDPRSGLTFEVCVYKQYKRVRYEIGIAWGVLMAKPAHTALLLG